MNPLSLPSARRNKDTACFLIHILGSSSVSFYWKIKYTAPFIYGISDMYLQDSKQEKGWIFIRSVLFYSLSSIWLSLLPHHKFQEALVHCSWCFAFWLLWITHFCSFSFDQTDKKEEALILFSFIFILLEVLTFVLLFLRWISCERGLLACYGLGLEGISLGFNWVGAKRGQRPC